MLKIDSIEFDDKKRSECRINNHIKKTEDAVEIFVDVLKINGEEEAVGMIALDSNNRLIGLVELMRGGDALEKIGTDDLFYKALALEADSIIFGYNKAGKIYTDSYDYQFNEFLLKQAEEFRIEVRYNLVLLDSNKWINIY
jgi:DNA repair protein RadC